MVFRGNVSNIKYLREYTIVYPLRVWLAPGQHPRIWLYPSEVPEHSASGVVLAIYSDFPELDSSAIGAAC